MAKPLLRVCGFVSHDLFVLAGACFGFIGVDNQIGRLFVVFGHERIFKIKGKSIPFSSSQPGYLNLLE
jgi:hypothetical protein